MVIEQPLISVVVPVRNGERTIRDCLASLLRMDYPETRRELLVVDNGSTDRTAEIIKSFPVRYVSEGCRGIPHARNRGIEASQGAIVAFTDADCVVDAAWLRELVRGFEEEGIGGVEGETVVSAGNPGRAIYGEKAEFLLPVAAYQSSLTLRDHRKRSLSPRGF